MINTSNTQADMQDQNDAEAKITELEAKLASAEALSQEYLDGWQRAKADFANARKEEDKKRASYRQDADADFAADILNVLDAFDNAQKNTELWNAVDPAWRKGIESIKDQLLAVLTKRGLQAVGEVGVPVDFNIHSPVAMVETDNPELDHTVAAVLQKGYVMKERTVRPARINVYEFVAKN